MATLQSTISDDGTLTGSGTQDVLVTADADSLEESVDIELRNSSGSTRTIIAYLNGTSTPNVRAIIVLATLEWCTIHYTLAANDVIYAEASAASSINWSLTRRIVK